MAQAYIPAALAPADSSAALSGPEQRAQLAAIAEAAIERAGDPGSSGMTNSDSDFSVRTYVAMSEADFLIRQRFGHRAYVQMQMEAARALAAQ